MKLYKGNVQVQGRKSPYSLYDKVSRPELAAPWNAPGTERVQGS